MHSGALGRNQVLDERLDKEFRSASKISWPIRQECKRNTTIHCEDTFNQTVGCGARSYLLVVDSQKRKISVTASGDAVRDTGVLNTDDLVLCKPETLDSGTLRATTSKEKTILKLGTKRPDIPLASSLVSMVENLGEDGVVSLELMSLTDSVGREIQTKDGLVKRTELTVAITREKSRYTAGGIYQNWSKTILLVTGFFLARSRFKHTKGRNSWRSRIIRQLENKNPSYSCQNPRVAT